MSRTTPRTALEAVLRPGFLISAWPWRALLYQVTTAPLAMLAGFPMLMLATPWLIAAIVLTRERPGQLPMVAILLLAGLVLVAGLGPLIALPLAEIERHRLRLVDDRPIRSGHRRPQRLGLLSWVETRYTEPATWRELGYTVLLVAVVPGTLFMLGMAFLIVAVLIVSPVLVAVSANPVSMGLATIESVPAALPWALAGIVALPPLSYLVGALTGVQATLARALLGSGSEAHLEAHLMEVSRSRTRLIDAFESERRRIERDLHDGAQQKLVGLTLQLGLARHDLPAESPAAHSVTEAHEQAKQLMGELRELIRGIHPKVLTDRGLPDALRALADQLSVPVTVAAEVPHRLPRQVEETAYFVVAEALTNVAKHSGAASAAVTARTEPELLVVEVTDSGVGGADPSRGTGLTGLADRVEAVGGRMWLASPAGGPTLLRVELPWHPQLPG